MHSDMSDSSLLHTTQSAHSEDIEEKKTFIKLLSLEVSNPLERASVFHTSGVFVHTFIKYGYGSGEMFGYHGIAVHKDSFVLVCNTNTDCQVR